MDREGRAVVQKGNEAQVYIFLETLYLVSPMPTFLQC